MIGSSEPPAESGRGPAAQNFRPTVCESLARIADQDAAGGFEMMHGKRETRGRLKGRCR